MTLNKKIGTVIGGAVLAVGLMALPALANSPQNPGNGWYDQMRSFMNRTFSPAQHQQFMSSGAMQNLHNSAGMQQAMQSGDINKMQELMNSDSNLKAAIGQENLNKMNQFMSNYQQQPSAPGKPANVKNPKNQNGVMQQTMTTGQLTQANRTSGQAAMMSSGTRVSGYGNGSSNNMMGW